MALVRTSAGNVKQGAKTHPGYPASWAIDPLKAAAMCGEKSRIDQANQAHLSQRMATWEPMNASSFRRLPNKPRRARFGKPQLLSLEASAEARPALPLYESPEPGSGHAVRHCSTADLPERERVQSARVSKVATVPECGDTHPGQKSTHALIENHRPRPRARD